MSSPEDVRADVIVEFDAVDNASPKVTTAAEKINAEYRKMRMEQRAVGAQFELNNRGFVASMRTMQSLGNIAQRGIGIFQAYTLAQTRLADAQRDLRDIQMDLQEAIASGDIQSEIRLRRQEADAIEKVNQVQRDNIIGYTTMAIVAGGAAAQIVRNVIPQLARVRASFRSTTAQVNSFNAAVRATTTATGAPTQTSGTPAVRATTTTAPRTTPRVGISGGIGLGGIGLLATGIINEVMSAEDPLKRLTEIVLDPLNFRGEKRDQIIINVRVGNETKQAVVDLHQPYAIE